MCSTEGGEWLLLDSGDGERPVLDAHHEVGPEEWRPVYGSFEALLAAYLDGDGRIETVAG